MVTKSWMSRIKAVVLWCKDVVGFFSLLIRRAVFFRQSGNPVLEKHKNVLEVLANGPSLKLKLNDFLRDNARHQSDFLVVNFFAFDPAFVVIKPNFYCFADPMFFTETSNEKKVRELFNILNDSVDWPINIFIPSFAYQKFVIYSKLDNKHITIRSISALEYSGFTKWKFFFFQKGWAAPKMYNVSILAIFVGLTLQYKRVNLYGVDHTFTNSITVDDNNILCNIDAHFYDKDVPALKPLIRIDNGLPWKVSEYLGFFAIVFKTHEELAAYASYLKVQVVNCTKGSMIDAYERQEQGKNIPKEPIL